MTKINLPSFFNPKDDVTDFFKNIDFVKEHIQELKTQYFFYELFNFIDQYKEISFDCDYSNEQIYDDSEKIEVFSKYFHFSNEFLNNELSNDILDKFQEDEHDITSKLHTIFTSFPDTDDQFILYFAGKEMNHTNIKDIARDYWSNLDKWLINLEKSDLDNKLSKPDFNKTSTLKPKV